MKPSLLKALVITMLFAWFVEGKAQNDLPPPTPNLQTIPKGALVLAMDNLYQGGSGTTVMNIKAYGLAVELLWNNIPLTWVIKTGKAKDGIDLNANATQVYPTSGSSFNDTFKAGPLVIMPADTAAARPVITAFNNKQVAASKVKLYKTNSVNNNIDIRYTLTHKPFIAVYDDGGNANIHISYLVNAAVDTSHYRTVVPGYTLDSSSCFTLASTPHWAVGSPAVYSSTDSLRIINLKSFLLSGGNFLAECEGIDAIENFGPVRFMSTGGMTTVNQNVTTQAYANSDMPIMQFHGAYTQGGGSLYNFLVNKVSSNWKNSMYLGAYFLKDVIKANGTLGTDGVMDTVVQINACKISAAATTGGNIFYLGGHSYAGTSALSEVNGERIYLNSLLIPTHRIIADGTLPTPYTVCQGDSIKINFTPPSTGYGFSWTGPNGYTSTIEDPAIANAQTIKAGVYSAQIANNEGCKFVYSTTVSVPLKPVFTAATTASMLCEGDSCTISVSPTASLTSVNWYLKDTTKSGCKPTGAVLYTTYTKVIKPTASGTYVAIAFNASGCTDTSCVLVTVDKLPVLTSPNSTASPLCYGRGTYATITAGYGGTGCTETYRYRVDGGVWTPYTSATRIGTGANDSVVIEAIRSCTSGCVNKTVRLKWNIASPQVVSATSSLTSCVNSAGYIASLSATNPSPSTGAWSVSTGPGSIVSPSSLSTTIGSLSKTGVVTKVNWIVTNSYGCKDTSQRTISPPSLDSSLISKYSREYCLTCPIQDNSTYSYYDVNGKLLARVTDSADAVSIGSTAFCGELPYIVSGNPASTDVWSVQSYIVDVGFVPQPYLPRAWNINTTNDAAMTVKLYFTDEEVSSLTTKTQQNGGYFDFGGNALRLLLVAYPNNSDTFIPAGAPAGVVYRPTYARVGTYWEATFRTAKSGTFYLYPPYWAADYALPVELTTLTATAVPQDGLIKVEWATASELDNAKFEIERGYDTKNFIKIGEIKGAGNSNSIKKYSFDDNQVVPGQKYYYRLKQIDNSGKYVYTKIVSANIDAKNEFSISEFMPNPALNTSIVNINTVNPTTIEVAVYGIDGSLIKEMKQDLDIGSNEFHMDISSLARGTYFVQFNSKEGRHMRKLIKLD